MNTMEIGTRVRSLSSPSEIGTILRAGTEGTGDEIEAKYLVTWDLDEPEDEPGWVWDMEIKAA